MYLMLAVTAYSFDSASSWQADNVPRATRRKCHRLSLPLWCGRVMQYPNPEKQSRQVIKLAEADEER